MRRDVGTEARPCAGTHHQPKRPEPPFKNNKNNNSPPTKPTKPDECGRYEVRGYPTMYAGAAADAAAATVARLDKFDTAKRTRNAEGVSAWLSDKWQL